MHNIDAPEHPLTRNSTILISSCKPLKPLSFLCSSNSCTIQHLSSRTIALDFKLIDTTFDGLMLAIMTLICVLLYTFVLAVN
ncbi:hypothetical protein CU097_004180 [Rhizopus azygosporus]|uniref:Uncharacterized protein n=1 Tax=Rhizopus azygosporus TaxID=86630 RepID=A0A367JMD1_RHIAZ|nr:hypothetical protein CU097_004180 [Rhizopus azygosporus]